MVFLAWRLVRQISFVNIIILVVAVSSGRFPLSGFGLLVLGGLALAAVGVLSWWRFVFVIEAGELRVDKGILAHEHLAIPLNRVQTVSLEQGLLHQVLGLTRVSVDTAGSSEVEFKFDALDRRRAEELQQVVARYREETREQETPATTAGAGRQTTPGLADAPPPVGPPSRAASPPVPVGQAPAGSVEGSIAASSAPAETLAIRTFGDLIRIGVGSWPWAGLVFIFPLLAVTEDLQALVGVDILGSLTGWVEQVESDGLGESISLPVLFSTLAGFLVLATLAGWIFQTVRAVLAHWEMALTLTRGSPGDTLRRDAGLLNRTAVSAQLARLQNVRVYQSLLQRAVGIHTVALHVTGETNIEVPGSSAAEVDRIVEVVIPPEPPAFTSEVAGAYVLREVRNGALIAVPITVVVALTWGWLALLGLLIPIQASISGLMYWKSMRWGFNDERIGYRHGMLNRQWHHLELIKTQSVTVRQSFYERRRGLATFRIRSAEGNFAIPFISLVDAEALRDRVLAHVESSNRSWM